MKNENEYEERDEERGDKGRVSVRARVRKCCRPVFETIARPDQDELIYRTATTWLDVMGPQLERTAGGRRLRCWMASVFRNRERHFLVATDVSWRADEGMSLSVEHVAELGPEDAEALLRLSIPCHTTVADTGVLESAELLTELLTDPPKWMMEGPLREALEGLFTEGFFSMLVALNEPSVRVKAELVFPEPLLTLLDRCFRALKGMLAEQGRSLPALPDLPQGLSPIKAAMLLMGSIIGPIVKAGDRAADLVNKEEAGLRKEHQALTKDLERMKQAAKRLPELLEARFDPNDEPSRLLYEEVTTANVREYGLVLATTLKFIDQQRHGQVSDQPYSVRATLRLGGRYFFCDSAYVVQLPHRVTQWVSRFEEITEEDVRDFCAVGEEVIGLTDDMDVCRIRKI